MQTVTELETDLLESLLREYPKSTLVYDYGGEYPIGILAQQLGSVDILHNAINAGVPKKELLFNSCLLMLRFFCIIWQQTQCTYQRG